MRPMIAIFAMMFANLGACSIGCEQPSPRLEPPLGSYTTSKMVVRVDGKEESVDVARVNPDFFGAPKIQPLLGRLFVSEEYRAGGSGVVTLAHDYWQSRFGGSPTIIGQQIHIDGRPMVVVGIGPRNFGLPNAQIWIPDVR